MEMIQKSIEVDAPVTKVYKQWTQFEEFPRFMAGVEQVTRSAKRAWLFHARAATASAWHWR